MLSRSWIVQDTEIFQWEIPYFSIHHSKYRSYHMLMRQKNLSSRKRPPRLDTLGGSLYATMGTRGFVSRAADGIEMLRFASTAERHRHEGHD